MIRVEAGAVAETAEIGDIRDIRNANAVVSEIAEDDIANESETRTHDSTNAETEATAHIPGSANFAAAASSGAASGKREVAVLQGRNTSGIAAEAEAPRRRGVTEGMSERGIGIGEVQGRNIELLRVGGVDLLIRESGIGRAGGGDDCVG
jgi:hypothetical protein